MATSLVVLVSAAATAVTLATPSAAGVLRPVYDPPTPVELEQTPQPAREAADREFAGLLEGEISCSVLRDDDGQPVFEFVAEDAYGAAHVVRFSKDGAPALLGLDEGSPRAGFTSLW